MNFKPLTDHAAKIVTGMIISGLLTVAGTIWQAKLALENLSLAVMELQENSYNTEYKEVLYELADSATHDEIITDITYWKADNKGGKLGAMDTLCREPGRSHLLKVMREKTATDACRIIGVAG
jgi:hypothetical protein